MPLDQRSFDTSYNHRSLIDKIPNTSISKTRSRSPSPTRNSSPPRLPPMAPSPLEAQRSSGSFVSEPHSREYDKRLVPNWLLNDVRGGDPRASGPPLRPPAWKGVFPSARDDDNKYPMPPPPSSYPFSLAPSKPRPIVGYPPVNINSYKGYDYPSSSSSSSYPGTRSAYPEHYPSDPYRSESPHSAAYSPPKYIKEDYRRESERYSPQRMDYPPPLPPRHYDAPPPPIRRSPPGVHPDSYRSEHIPHSMYIDHHMPPRPEYPYDPYARHYESPLSTSIRRTEITRSADSDARLDRRAMWERDQRRTESSPDFSSDPYLHDEGVYERQSDMYRREVRRHELAAKLSPPSPTTTSSRPYSPYESHPYQSAYPPKPRASPFPAERRSRSPSPHRSDPHNHSTPNPSPTPTTASSSAPTATPAPIFTMESPGGFNIGADGKAAAPHPKNPVKFEFKDFKENEYNLHSLQNSGGNTSLLSLKQQKRHKRIINRALAQGQARARARATQPENSDSPQGEVKAMHEGHKQHHAEERKTKRATRLPSPSSPPSSPSSSSASSASDSDHEPIRSNKRKSIEEKELEEFLPEGEDQDPKKQKRILQTSGGCVIEQFETYEELHQDMVKPVTRASTRLRTRTLSGNVISGKIHCICNRPETDSMVQCDSCDKWFHLECVGMNESSAQEIMAYFCAECRSRGSLTKKARIEDLIAESDQPSTRSPSDSQSSSSDQSSILSPKETSDDMDEDEEDEEDLPAGDDDTIQIGDGVVSISSLAKQPWLDGWVTARSFAVRYLKEAKRLGHEISSNRRFPKQVAVRNSGKVKSWRQAEVLLAIQFLKSSDLVETSTKKGTLVREPCRTMDDLISRAQIVEMPNRGNIGKVKVVEFARQRNQSQIIPQQHQHQQQNNHLHHNQQQQQQQQQSIIMEGDRDEKKEMVQ